MIRGPEMIIKLPALALIANLFFAAGAFAAAELTVESGKFDFGSVPQGKKVQHSFKIKNSGDAPLQIKQLEADCGCTAAKPSSSLIAPGKTAEVEVTFDSENFSGPVQKNVAMTTNAASTPNYTFTLHGTVLDPVQVTPRQLSLGALQMGKEKQVEVKVTNNGSANLKILGVTSNSNTLQIKSNIKKSELKPGEATTVEFSISPTTPAKILSGYVHIQISHAQKKEITLPVYGSGPK
jgi:uncharacterized membrane protein